MSGNQVAVIVFGILLSIAWIGGGLYFFVLKPRKGKKNKQEELKQELVNVRRRIQEILDEIHRWEETDAKIVSQVVDHGSDSERRRQAKRSEDVYHNHQLIWELQKREKRLKTELGL